jgi:AIR synthase-related protein
MDLLTLPQVVGALRASAVFRAKGDIRTAAEFFRTAAGDAAIRNGDDAAAIPDGDGYLLLAAEGIIPALVRRDPYLAGRSAVLANVNDIYAMGGRPLALVDVVGADCAAARELCRGMRDGAARYGVPIVGGHLLRGGADVSLSVAVLGRARSLVTSFDAQPGDRLVLVTNDDGCWLEDHGYWNATLTRNDARLRDHLELIPRAAEAGLVRAGKDVSMSGISGTVLMLAEASGVGARVDLDAVAPPPGVPLVPWLLAFMSYGFVLAVRPEALPALAAPFLERGLRAAEIGSVTTGSEVTLRWGPDEAVLWDWRAQPFTGMRAA